MKNTNTSNKIITLNSADKVSLTIPYEIIRSKRKTCSIEINKDGMITLRLPLYVTNTEAVKILTDKQEWIIRKLDFIESRQEKTPSHSYSDIQRAAIEKRYREAAMRYLPERASYYAAAYPAVIKGSYVRISIRDQKTRWGSCSSKGNLNFNWRLMLAPPHILDYVVVHELCHLTHMNHSTQFWKCVEDILPDYKECRKWLKEHGNELTLS